MASTSKFGKVFELDGVNLRVLDHEANVHAIQGSPYQVLQDVPGICAWVGRMSEKGQVIDSFPIFYATEAGRSLTPELVGAFIFADIARDLAVKSRLEPSWAVPQIGHLDEHSRLEYGADVHNYLMAEFVNKKLGVGNANFLNKRVGRILAANYPNALPLIQVDGRRLVLRKPWHRKLYVLEDGLVFKSLADFANHLGRLYLQAVAQMEAAPQAPGRAPLTERAFFSVTED